MLSAGRLLELADKLGELSEVMTEKGHVAESIQAQIACAIYTVGAELIGRLDNLHFEFEMREPGSHYQFHATGRLFIRSKNDNSSKSEDSSTGQEEVRTPTSPEG